MNFEKVNFPIASELHEELGIDSPAIDFMDTITTITNESSTKLSSTTDQVTKSSITNNNTEPLSIKLLSEIATIIN